MRTITASNIRQLSRMEDKNQIAEIPGLKGQLATCQAWK